MCFAGYLNDPKIPDDDEELFKESNDKDILAKGQLSEVLIDSDTERFIFPNDPLKLAQGYELVIKNSIEKGGKNVYLELVKDGQIVDTKVISPSSQGATYYYKKDLGQAKNLVIIAVHFQFAVNHADPECTNCNTDAADIDGVWQISDTPISVKVDEEYNKMSIRNVDPTTMTITMDNKDNKVTLSKNKDIMLMGDIQIKTADSNDEPNRFYIHKSVQICEGSF
jgi:S-layer protein (TIGR01567 family)